MEAHPIKLAQYSSKWLRFVLDGFRWVFWCSEFKGSFAYRFGCFDEGFLCNALQVMA